MGVYKIAGLILLPALAVVSILSTHKFALDNGLAAQLDKTMSAKYPTLPDTPHALITSWTGIKQLDHLLTLMNTFFAPCLDPKNPKNILQSIHFLGQLASIYTVMVLESMRIGNAGMLVSYFAVWGMLGEWVVMAFAVPVFGFVHLLTSPGASAWVSQTSIQRKTALLVHPVSLQVLPWAVAIGHGIPAFFQLRSSAAVVTPFYQSRQFWVLMRLIHPILTSVALRTLEAAFYSPTAANFPSAEQRNRNVARGLQRVYSFARVLAVVPHLGAATLFVLARVGPSIFAKTYLPVFAAPLSIFTPVPFWPVAPAAKTTSSGWGAAPVPKIGILRAPSIAEGSRWLLQWDFATMSAAGLVWAFVVNRETLLGQPRETGKSSFPSLLVRVVGWTVLGGPAAAAISLLKERDQILLDQIEGSPAPTTGAAPPLPPALAAIANAGTGASAGKAAGTSSPTTAKANALPSRGAPVAVQAPAPVPAGVARSGSVRSAGPGSSRDGPGAVQQYTVQVPLSTANTAAATAAAATTPPKPRRV